MKSQFTARELRALNAEVAARDADPLAEEMMSWPDCTCGWSGTGTGGDGKFMRGDRCPRCEQILS